MRERDVERYLIERVRAIGGLCFKWVSPSQRGVPDRIVIYRGRVVFVEVKAPSGVLAAAQRVMLDSLRKHGAEVRVLRSKELVDVFVDELKGTDGEAA